MLLTPCFFMYTLENETDQVQKFCTKLSRNIKPPYHKSNPLLTQITTYKPY